MSLGMYAASVPVFEQHLHGLDRVLDKGAAFAQARKLDPAIVLGTRLYPDMYPLVRQAQEVTKHVRWACTMLAGNERPDVPMPETTFPELKQRIADTVAFLKGIRPEQIDGAEARAVVLQFPGGKLEFTGQDYLLGFGLPNFFFHLTSAYGILRHLGVELSKRDFLGK